MGSYKGYSYYFKDPLPVNQLNVAPEKIVVLLGAGGFTGAVQPRILKLLDDNGVPIDKVLGVSVGAINGASYVSHGSADESIRIWGSLKKSTEVFDLQPKLHFIRKLGMPESVYRFEPLAHLVGKINVEKLVLSPKEFIAVTTRVYPKFIPPEKRRRSGKVTYFSSKNPEMIADPKKMWLAIMASCSFPTGFPPVPINYRGEDGWYVDGAFKRLFPLMKAIEDGCNTIIAVRSRSDTTQGPYPGNWLERTAFCIDMLHDTDEKDEIRLACDKLKNINLFILEPEKFPDTLTTISFKMGDLHRAMDEGERVGRRDLEPLFQHYRSQRNPSGS